MFIGHLPAGFLLTRWLQKKLNTTKLMVIGLIASVFPDVDMLYFYLIDDRQTLHHHYITHLPLFWIAIGIVLIPVTKLRKQPALLAVTIIIIANLLLHFALDSIVGGINWLYPFVDHDLSLFTVPAKYDFWVWSFVFHWTFLLEVAVVVAAGLTFYRDRRQRTTGNL